MMAAGARPEHISGKAREACSATSAKSQTIARPKPKPNASPWTSATLINGELRKAALNLRIRADSRRIAARVRPARSRPVQKTLPRAQRRKTRARGFDASLRSSASMASNIAPVTSLPWLELSRVKVRTSAVRSITTPRLAVGLEATLSFLLVMAARYRRNAGLSNGAGASGSNKRSPESPFQPRSVTHFVVHAATSENLKNDKRLRSCHFALYTPLCPVQDGNKGSRHRAPIGAVGLDCGGPHPKRPGKARPKQFLHRHARDTRRGNVFRCQAVRR